MEKKKHMAELWKGKKEKLLALQNSGGNFEIGFTAAFPWQHKLISQQLVIIFLLSTGSVKHLQPRPRQTSMKKKSGRNPNAFGF